ncbi:hypothetical protein ILYODFUR_037570, partial [Ilyodon furcidens]
SAQVNFTLTLDANRKIPNNRARISKNLREKTGSLSLRLNKEICYNVDFIIDACPEDALNPIKNELRFTFEGLPSGTKPRPSLSPQVQTTTFHSVSNLYTRFIQTARSLLCFNLSTTFMGSFPG